VPSSFVETARLNVGIGLAIVAAPLSFIEMARWNVEARPAAADFASSVARISLVVVSGNFSRNHSRLAIFLISGGLR
jgi:hypothetical protein